MILLVEKAGLSDDFLANEVLDEKLKEAEKKIEILKAKAESGAHFEAFKTEQ